MPNSQKQEGTCYVGAWKISLCQTKYLCEYGFPVFVVFLRAIDNFGQRSTYNNATTFSSDGS